jgi:hypothetical protein
MLRVKRSLRSLEDRRRARLDESREPADTDWYALMARLQAAERAAAERRIAAAASALDRLR